MSRFFFELVLRQHACINDASLTIHKAKCDPRIAGVNQHRAKIVPVAELAAWIDLSKK